jgi:hypothetical protein
MRPWFKAAKEHAAFRALGHLDRRGTVVQHVRVSAPAKQPARSSATSGPFHVHPGVVQVALGHRGEERVDQRRRPKANRGKKGREGQALIETPPSPPRRPRAPARTPAARPADAALRVEEKNRFVPAASLPKCSLCFFCRRLLLQARFPAPSVWCAFVLCLRSCPALPCVRSPPPTSVKGKRIHVFARRGGGGSQPAPAA